MDKSLVMLIVDDVESNRNILKEILKDDFTFFEAENGMEAIKLLRRRSGISVVLLDIFMPIMDGFEVLSLMKKDKYLSDIPIIINALEEKQDIESKALRLGASDFICKPYNKDIVKKRIQNVLIRKNYEYEIQKDLLTHIYNKNTFYIKTSEMLNENKKKKYVMVCCDIERFKEINALFGIKIGDKVLKKFAEVLQDNFNNIGTYGRIFGDNFAICLPKMNLNIKDILNKIDTALAECKLNYKIAIRAGIYVIDDITQDVNDMYNKANIVLSTIRPGCQKRFAYYNEKIKNNLLEEQEVINEMNNALERKEFILYFQPVYSFENEEVVSAEVLVRWNHPQKGMIYPRAFIPLFEKSGFITKMDYYVWEEACKFLRKCIDKGKKIVPVSLNVSKVNFYNNHLAQSIILLIKKYKLDPSMIKLEITESAYIDNPRRLIKTINILSEYGLEILMDDFENKTSFVNMLKDVPVDVLKIDMSFIDSLEFCESVGNIITGVVKMAKWLNMVVISERVETKWQCDFLKSIGCDRAQGFYYFKPLSKKKFIDVLQNQKSSIRNIKKDFSLDNVDFETVLKTNKAINMLLSGMFSGMGIYKFYNDKLEILWVNDGYYELMDYTPKILKKISKNIIMYLYKDDRNIVIQMCKKAIRTKKTQQVIVRRKNKSNNYFWINIKMRCIRRKGKSYTLYFAFNEVTNEKDIPTKYNISCYKQALKTAYREIVELNYTDNIFRYVYTNGEFVFSKCNNEDKLDEKLHSFAINKVEPSFRDEFLNIYKLENIKDKFKNLSQNHFTIQVKIKMKDLVYEWAMLTIIKLKNSLGKDIYLSCNRLCYHNNRFITDKNCTGFNYEISQHNTFNNDDKQYKMLIQESGVILFEYDVENKIMCYSYNNDNARKEYKVLKEFTDFNICSEHINNAYIPLCTKTLKKACKKEVTGQIEYKIKTRDKKYRWHRAAYMSLSNDSGKIYKIIGMVSDIEEEKSQKELLEKRKYYLNAAISESLFVYEFDTCKDEINLIHQKKGSNFYPYKSYLYVNKNKHLFHPNDYANVVTFFSKEKHIEAYGKNPTERKLQYRIRNLNDEWVWVEATIYPIEYNRGKYSRGIGYIEVINDRKELEQMAQMDGLTCIYNRRTLEEKIEDSIKSNANMGIFFLYDIDNFKMVNDTYGHAEGDRLLVRVSEIIKINFDINDIVGRLGGDEFCAFICENYKKDECKKKAERTIEDICGLEEEFGWEIPITVSLGISIAPKNGKTFDILYRAADEALYMAKNRGKNRFWICC